MRGIGVLVASGAERTDSAFREGMIQVSEPFWSVGVDPKEVENIDKLALA